MGVVMATSPFFVVDRTATKSIGLSELAPDMAATWFGQRSARLPLSSAEAWRCLGVLYRAVDVRAKAVSRAPLTLYQGNGKTDVSAQPRYTPLLERLRALLYLNEAAICLYGAA